MDYYLVMEGVFHHDQKLRKLTATNMEDAKKETFIISLCDSRRYELPEQIDFEDFDSWLIRWLGGKFIVELAEDIIEQYKLLKKEYRNDNGMRERCKDIEVGYDHYHIQNSTILEVTNIDKNAIATARNISEKIKTIALQKAKNMIETEERAKLEELKKKYGE